MTTCALERRGRHHAQTNLLKLTIQTSCRWMLIPCTVKGGKGKKGKGKGKNKGDRSRHDGKGKGEQSVQQRYFDGNCNQCGENGHTKPDCAGKNKFFNGTCNRCGAHGHKRVDGPVKAVAHLESESVIESNDEPTGIESLEWLFALEHDGETMASLTDAPVRLLLVSGSGVSACSPEFAPHVKTLTGSSVHARSATGQVTKHGSAEDLEANRVGWQDGALRAQDCSG